MTTWHPCSDLGTRALKWVADSDNAKNGDGRPSPFVCWGVDAVSISASYREAHSSDVVTSAWVD